MGPSSILYSVAQTTLRAATPLLAGGRSKFARGLAGRRHAHHRLADWGHAERDAARRLVWFHAPSVGEGLQAKVVLARLRERMPDAQFAYTHFSPSAEALAAGLGVDVADYLPWDQPAPVDRVLDSLRPSMVVFTKTEVWPGLVAAATRRGIPCSLVAGTLPPGAGRSRWPARSFLRPTWSALGAVGATSDADAAAFAGIGVPPDRLTVTGDPGIDAAARRAREADPGAPHLAPFHADRAPTVVAGSTWPSDESRLLSVIAALRGSIPGLRVVLVPHEPTPEHVRGLLDRLRSDGWHPRTLTEVESGALEDAVVVDRVGVLSELYTVGTVAYVGGGFHGAGLHSVLEPASAGLPVVFGPRHQNARAAGDLLACGGARVVDGTGALRGVLETWLQEPGERDYAGRSARGYIQRHQGAAERSAVLLEELLERSGR